MQPKTPSPTKSKASKSPQRKPEKKNELTLFQMLNRKLERDYVCRSCRHHHHEESSDEDIGLSLEALQIENRKMLNSWMGDSDKVLERDSTPIKKSEQNEQSEQVDLVQEIKEQARLQALDLNRRFLSLSRFTGISVDEEIDLATFVKYFDRGFEMIEAMYATFASVKRIILASETALRGKEAAHEERQGLFEQYARELLLHSAAARGLVEVASQLMSTSFFQSESKEVVGMLLALVQLHPRGSSLYNKYSVKSSVLEYSEIVRKIEALGTVTHRVEIELSEGFVDLLKRKPKAKKNK